MRNLLLVILIAFVALHLQAADGNRAPAVVPTTTTDLNNVGEGLAGHSVNKAVAEQIAKDQARLDKLNEEVEARDAAQQAAEKARVSGEQRKLAEQYRLEAEAALKTPEQDTKAVLVGQSDTVAKTRNSKAAFAIYESARIAKLNYNDDRSEENLRFLFRTYLNTARFLREHEDELDYTAVETHEWMRIKNRPFERWGEFEGWARELLPSDRRNFEKEYEMLNKYYESLPKKSS